MLALAFASALTSVALLQARMVFSCGLKRFYSREIHLKARSKS